jgi:alanyl-tRNA synthetase
MTNSQIRSSSQVRRDFLDFFKSKQHTIVPSSSLMPDSPNLLFTNAGMNQFVPIFLGQTQCPYHPGRAADTQKCIRAGGKHNDLDDVGLDTYHHTFFEMLGNWSFGDYFKKEAIDWAWELIVEVWKFPPQRLYATVYSPDKAKNDPSEFDQEAWDFWAEKFRRVGLDPAIHIVNGNKKDNFWMMGETGPCGPCSELHVDLTPDGNTKGSLVNKGDARCIEIWNLVFIQFNANPDGTFSPLPAKHVDTGMGFERVTSIIQGTKNFTDFANAKISNYETDIFRPIFDALEKLSGRKYGSTLPGDAVLHIGKGGDGEAVKSTGECQGDIIEVNSGVQDKPLPDDNDVTTTEQIALDVAFRVIADHIRTLSFAIADGIEPGNGERNYVLRRILRRAVRYGRVLGFQDPFFYKLVDVLVETMGDVFPELRLRKKQVQEIIKREEEAFNKTLDRGIEIFNDYIKGELANMEHNAKIGWKARVPVITLFSGQRAFELYDTYGFPLDLTQLMAGEHGFNVDVKVFNELMEQQKARARAAQKKEVISLSQIETTTPTNFVGYDNLATEARVLEVVSLKDKTAVILDTSACYAEMGGQVGDTGELTGSGQLWRVVNTQKSGNTFLHFVEGGDAPAVGAAVTLAVDQGHRNAIQRHHTVTHLLHWALHEVVSREASQKGSFVGTDKLTFDFNSQPLTPAQVADIEKLVNERILENAPVSWLNVKHNQIKDRKDVMQFFGDKYGELVRVVQIGGKPTALDGYSMELCGGTHTRATGEIGLFRIVGENAIAAGVRRIEAVAGLAAYDLANEQLQLIKNIAGRVSSPVHELEKKIEALLAQQKELEKSLKSAIQRNAAQVAGGLPERAQEINGVPLITQHFPEADADYLQAVVDALKGRFKGVIVLGGAANGAVSLVASVSPDFTAKVQAGKIIQAIAPIVGGKGGGKPDNARGGGKDAGKLDEALAKVKTLIG